jgi:TolB-like protein/DNA-binding winged helix-turn-helix (wHTH) protein/Tfp pilus assembly protein PilF
MPQARQHRYSFDRFTVDFDRAALLRDGVPVSLRPRSFDALRYLIENRGRLATKDELVQALWPRTVVTDDSLVKCIQDVRIALEDDGHRYVKTVPRRGYIFDAQVTVDGPASSAALPEPEAAERPNVTPASESSTAVEHVSRAAGGKRTLFVFGGAAACVAAVLVAFFALDRPPPIRATIPRSIAVLPFESLSGDADNEYFAAGIHESLLNQLAKIDGVKTIARTSVLRFAGAVKPVHEIAQELNVEAVVEGSVQYADGRVRVTAQLIDPTNDTHLWSEAYDRPFADIFAIQTDIASRIASALDVELTSAERTTVATFATRSPEAYELYLRGRYHWDKWTPADATRAAEYFEQAIRLDPGYALAYAGLADANTALQAFGVVPGYEVMPKAKRAIEQALAIDPELPEAYIARGTIKHFYDWDYAGGNADFDRALELEPRSAIAHQLYGKNLTTTLQLERALAELDLALELEPFSIGINKDLGETLYVARRYDEAIARFLRVLELEPNSPPAYYWLSHCYAQKGDRAKAVEYYIARSETSDAGAARLLEETYRRSGWDGFWRAVVDQQERSARERYVEPVQIAYTYVRLEDKDAAFAWLERAIAARSAWIPWLAIDPMFDPLRGDPRLEDLERRAGLRPDYVPRQ